MFLSFRGGLYDRHLLDSAIVALVLFFIPLISTAETMPDVVINEVMWDGTEYIELYNPSSEAIALQNWSLHRKRPDTAQALIVQFSASDSIGTHGYFLIEVILSFPPKTLSEIN